VLSLDPGSAVLKENSGFVHPVNYFLQQDALNQIWAERAGLGFGGGSGGAGDAQAGEGGAEAVVEEEVTKGVTKSKWRLRWSSIRSSIWLGWEVDC